MSEGWIKLHRKLQDNSLWSSEPFTRGQAWVDLILLANHEPGFIYVRDHRIDLKRGDVGWSQNRLSGRWQWSRTKVRKFLNDLEKEQQIKQIKSNSYTVIRLINYKDYQKKKDEKTTEKQQKNNSSTTEKQQKDTNKNVKNVKNEKEGGSPPSKNDLIEYFSEKGDMLENDIPLEAENFINHYEDREWKNSSGKKIKEWKRQASTWNNNYKKFNYDRLKKENNQQQIFDGGTW